MVRGDTNQGVRMVYNFPCFSCAPWQKQVVRGDTNHDIKKPRRESGLIDC